MDLSAKICEKITEKIANTVGTYSADELEVINYGLMIFVSTIFKLSVIMLIAAFLGILKPVLVAFFAFGILRTFAGGMHAKTSLQCLISMILIYLAIVYGATYIPINTFYKSVLFLIGFILIFFYAPADTAEKPILNEKQKKILRFCALITITLLYITSLLTPETLSNTITFAAFMECITITPAAYYITKSKRGDAYESFQNHDHV